MLAQVEPGELRSRLPAVAARARRAVRERPARPRRGPPARRHALAEPALLRLLREHRLGAGHPRRAAQRRAEPGRDPLAHVAGAAGARGGDARLARAAARAAGRPARPHRGHRLDRRRWPRSRRRAQRQAGRARRRLLRARALVGREGVPAARARGCARRRSTTRSGCGRTRSTSTDACAVVATIGTTSTSSVDPVPAIADACERAPAPGSTSTPPTPARRPSARSSATHFAGWERADSIVVNPHKWLLTPMDCSTLWTRRPDDLRAAFSLVPEYLRVSEEVASLSEYSPVLGRRFRALKLWAVLRCYGREGLQERIREAIRLAALFEGWVRDEPGWEVDGAAAVLARLLPPRRLRRGERGAARARQRDRRDLHLAHEAERPLRAAARGRQRAHDRGRRAPRLGRAQAGSGSGVAREAVEQLLERARRRLRRARRRACGRRRGGRTRSRRVSTSDVVVLRDPRSRRAVDERRLLVPDPERDPAARGRAARARGRARASSQPGSSASAGGGPSRAGAPARELVQHRPQLVPARASARRRSRPHGGGSFFFSTMPAASSSFSRAARMFVPIPGSPVDEVGVALRPVQRARARRAASSARRRGRAHARSGSTGRSRFTYFTFCTHDTCETQVIPVSFASTNVEREGIAWLRHPA